MKNNNRKIRQIKRLKQKKKLENPGTRKLGPKEGYCPNIKCQTTNKLHTKDNLQEHRTERDFVQKQSTNKKQGLPKGSFRKETIGKRYERIELAFVF